MRTNEIKDKFGERQEVVFWHFWGGEDGLVVEDIVNRFNDSQNDYYVRPVAMPGNNINLKILASVAGGSPPDLVNIDDPVVGDWGSKEIIVPLEDFVPKKELEELNRFLVPPAKKLGIFQNRLYAVCNGLDLRALYVNKTALAKNHFSVPQTAEQLQQICFRFVSKEDGAKTESFPFLPDSRRLWSWGFVFGGSFFDFPSSRCTANQKEIVQAMNWMVEFPRRYGAPVVSKFRSGDQSLPGKKFPLLPVDIKKDVGRYWMIQDGQWRVRDLNSFNRDRQNEGLPIVEFDVIPLPRPKKFSSSSPESAFGWVNGNLFVVPKGSKCKDGAWEFMKFWIGMTDPSQAAKTCSKGGWIPVSTEVSEHPVFKTELKKNPLFEKFVRMSKSPNWSPIPVIPGAARFRREIELTVGRSFQNPSDETEGALNRATKTIDAHLIRSR